MWVYSLCLNPPSYENAMPQPFRIPRSPHRWQVSPRRAIEIQRAMAERVIARSSPKTYRYVAGTDLAFANNGSVCIAGVVVWDIADKCVVEQHTARRPVTFPYVPGLLSFREAPALLAVLRKLRKKPDAVICDGQGLAHPRRFGLACHVGVIIDLPTIGCAKSRLTGTHRDPGPARGSRTALHDGEQQLGVVLRTRTGVKPVYVSIGHRIDVASAARLVLACTTRYRLPEPTRLADQLVGAAGRAARAAD